MPARSRRDCLALAEEITNRPNFTKEDSARVSALIAMTQMLSPSIGEARVRTQNLREELKPGQPTDSEIPQPRLLLESHRPTAGGEMKFIEQPLAVPTKQLLELEQLMERRFVAGAIACRAELENRPSNAARPTLLLITGSPGAADDFRNLFQVGAILEGQSQGAGVIAAIAAVDEMILCVRASLEENDDARSVFRLRMNLAF